jgi:hypothetical protein
VVDQIAPYFCGAVIISSPTLYFPLQPPSLPSSFHRAFTLVRGTTTPEDHPTHGKWPRPTPYQTLGPRPAGRAGEPYPPDATGISSDWLPRSTWSARACQHGLKRGSHPIIKRRSYQFRHNVVNRLLGAPISAQHLRCAVDEHPAGPSRGGYDLLQLLRIQANFGAQTHSFRGCCKVNSRHSLSHKFQLGIICGSRHSSRALLPDKVLALWKINLRKI